MTGFITILLGTSWAYLIIPELAQLEVQAWQRRRARTTSVALSEKRAA